MFRLPARIRWHGWRHLFQRELCGFRLRSFLDVDAAAFLDMPGLPLVTIFVTLTNVWLQDPGAELSRQGFCLSASLRTHDLVHADDTLIADIDVAIAEALCNALGALVVSMG